VQEDKKFGQDLTNLITNIACHVFYCPQNSMTECVWWNTAATGGRPRYHNLFIIKWSHFASSECLDVWTSRSSQDPRRTCRRLLW